MNKDQAKMLFRKITKKPHKSLAYKPRVTQKEQIVQIQPKISFDEYVIQQRNAIAEERKQLANMKILSLLKCHNVTLTT